MRSTDIGRETICGAAFTFTGTGDDIRFILILRLWQSHLRDTLVDLEEAAEDTPVDATGHR